MADQPRKKVVVVTRKKADAPPEPAASDASKAGAFKANAPKADASAGRKKQDDKKKLLDLQRLLDFPAGVANNAREVWMAGIGALSSVEEAGQALFDELVKKGEAWERDSRQKLVGAKAQAEKTAGKAKGVAQEMSRKPGELAAATETQIQRVVEDTVEGVLHRIGVPTHDEVQALVRHVDTLAEKVDTLTRRLRAAEATASPAVDPPRTIIQAPADAPPEAEVRAASPKADPPAPTKKKAPAPSKPTASKAPSSKAAASKAIASAAAASDETVYRVEPGEDGWGVQREGASRAASRHATKAEAVSAARDLAKSKTPSRLVILRQDGTVQSESSYDAE